MFRFTLYDYTNSDGQTPVVLKKEPLGFDGFIIRLIRSGNYRGVSFESSLTQLEIDDPVGLKLIKDAYAAEGINAVVNLKIEYACEDCIDCYETILDLKLFFDLYEDKCGTYCSIKTDVEQKGFRMMWKLNEETKVNLDSLKAFDGVTDMEPYEYLGKEIDLPSKAIVLSNQGNLSEDVAQVWFTDITNTFDYPPSPYELFIYPPLEINLSELDTIYGSPLVQWYLNPQTSGADGEEDYLFINNIADRCNDNTAFHVNIRQKFQFSVDVSTLAGDPTIKLTLIKKKVDNSLVVIYTSADQSVNVGDTHSCDADITIDQDITLDAGEKLIIAVKFAFETLGGTLFNSMNINFSKESYFKITNLSKCSTTPCKQYLLNEVFSRIVEATTNGNMRVYSDFYGRPDAMPYISATDGEGALKAITKGLFIRQINKTRDTNTQPVFSVSFKEVFDSVNAIDNIGCVVEEDPNRPGFELLRIEKVKYFYKDEIVLDLGEVSVTKKVNSKAMYNIFKFGYDKWEAEQFNGLDEFLTAREYKLNLQVKTTYERICKFIASGYAIEITKREGNDNSKDWRYDEDTFIICMQRDGSDIVVEQGGISGAENIIDPDSIFNFRISPIRNAMRWIQDLLKGFKNQSAARLDFSSGEANYFAKGKYTGFNVQELNAIAENETLDKTKFELQLDAVPYLAAELDEVKDYPLSYADYKTLRANPHALTAYSCKGNIQYGWLDNVQYRIEDGTADFTFIPKF